MTQFRRSIALLLVLLVVPSIFWILVETFLAISGSSEWSSSESWFHFLKELSFVACLTIPAIAVWRGSRRWPFILLVFVGFQTYITAWQFAREVLFVPSRWSYFDIVRAEAERRGLDDGPLLVWNLIVVPLALLVLSLISVLLCVANQRTRRVS